MNRFSALSLDGTDKPSAFKHAMAAKKQGVPLQQYRPPTAKSAAIAKENPLAKDNFPSLGSKKAQTAQKAQTCWKSVETIKAAVDLPVPESKFKNVDNQKRVKTPPLDIDRYYNDPTYVAIMSKSGVVFVDENGEEPEDTIPSYLRSEVEGYNRYKGTYDESDWD